MDKGTVKPNVTQPTLIRVVSLNKNSLFQKLFLSHPQVTSHTGENIARLLLSSITETLSWTIGTTRERFRVGSFDGQYHPLYIPDHFATKLSLDSEFTRDAVTWDIVRPSNLS